MKIFNKNFFFIKFCKQFSSPAVDERDSEEGNKSWLPDFGEPALRTRNREDYHEAAAAHHYSGQG